MKPLSSLFWNLVFLIYREKELSQIKVKHIKFWFHKKRLKKLLSVPLNKTHIINQKRKYFRQLKNIAMFTTPTLKFELNKSQKNLDLSTMCSVSPTGYQFLG